MTSPQGTPPLNVPLAMILGVGSLSGVIETDDPQAAYQLLVKREDDIKDALRMAAAENGLILPFVNLLLDQVQLGTPMTEIEREHAASQMRQLVAEADQHMIGVVHVEVAQLTPEQVEALRQMGLLPPEGGG